ncbi:MAG: carbamate kinase [Pseudonocardiales bacterium]|nr:carbamate kinase [Pseudonocardiales bacterium]
MRVVIALGGNAMTAADGNARPESQRAAVERAAEPIADIVAGGHQVVLTHGNGPQVGNLLVKNELAASVVPPVPLDWCGAQTQGTIGLLLLNALDRALAHRGRAVRTAALVSRTRVSVDDPGFAKPTKPIGRYLPGPQAALMMEHGQSWQDRGERGWRRVVASPEPLECLDSPAAVTLLNAGYLVVCAGGGGIPVVSDLDGTLRGIEAVVDKDLTAALLALSLAADRLIIATDVEQVVMGWASQAPRPIGQIRVSRLRELADRGEFASGSMGPKVEAACRYAESSGRPAVITSLERIRDALRDSHGTVVLPDLETPASEGELGA